jgi:glycosyltransferase involved in cell wall biosynthesis/protein-L-isoaspartate O-methyltransferase
MNVWMITPYSPLNRSKFHGGVEVFSFEVRERLSKKHRVTFIDKGEKNSEFVKSLALASEVRRRLKSERPDVLISNGILGWSFSTLDIPRVNIYHGTYEGMRRAVKGSLLGSLHKKVFLSRLESLSGKNALKVAVSSNTADELHEFYGFSRKDIVVIEGGADTKRFVPLSTILEKVQLRKKYGIPIDKVVCAYTASLTYRKGWDVVQRLSECFPDLFFLCTTRDFRKNNIAGLEIPYDQIHEIYQLSDIYLYPSRYDGFSLGLIEAMSCGLPFIGFPSGFCRDLKSNPSFSFYIAENEEEFVKLLRELSNDESLRLALGTKCRRFAENHDWDSVAKKIDVVLKNAVEREAVVNAKQWSPTRKKLELSLENSQHMVLDVGSGTGWLSHEHAKRLKRVVAIETAQDRAEISKIHHIFKVCKADAKSLPLRNSIFGTVVCYDVLEHMPNYPEALREFKRVLKSNGRLIMAIPNAKGSYTLLHDRLMYFRKKVLKSDLRLDNINFFEYEAILSVLNSLGFKACSTTNIEFLSPVFTFSGVSKSSVSFQSLTQDLRNNSLPKLFRNG